MLSQAESVFGWAGQITELVWMKKGICGSEGVQIRRMEHLSGERIFLKGSLHDVS